jgi:hypothetical protein
MRSAAEREAAAVWLHKMHQQFFELEARSNFDFCDLCGRVVEESIPHDIDQHGGLGK